MLSHHEHCNHHLFEHRPENTQVNNPLTTQCAWRSPQQPALPHRAAHPAPHGTMLHWDMSQLPLEIQNWKYRTGNIYFALAWTLLCLGKCVFCNRARLHHLESRCFKRWVLQPHNPQSRQKPGNEMACDLWWTQNLVGGGGICNIKVPQERERIVCSDIQTRCARLWIKTKVRGKIPTDVFGTSSSCPCKVKINHLRNTMVHLRGVRQQGHSNRSCLISHHSLLQKAVRCSWRWQLPKSTSTHCCLCRGLSWVKASHAWQGYTATHQTLSLSHVQFSSLPLEVPWEEPKVLPLLPCSSPSSSRESPTE